LLGSFRLLWEAGTVTGLSDAQLLERSAAGGPAAELAFAALVERHGPMVLRACRRLLRDPHDAQDAFQATFVVLARRARSIRDPSALAGWLHGVALRASRGLRADADRRRHHERRAAGAARRDAEPGPADRSDLAAVLHEEIGRLPDRFRSAVVLCDLEGLTHEQAARRLGCPVGTVKSRHWTARDRLRRRLSRRGFAPAAGALASSLAGESAGAAVSVPLMDSTVAAATAAAAGQAAAVAGLVPASVAALSERVLHAMFMSKLKVVGVAAAALVVTGLALGQSPTPSPDADAPKADDRLEQVNRKLDRLLQAIEGRDFGPRGEVTPRPTEAAKTASADPFVLKNQPGPPGRYGLDPNASSFGPPVAGVGQADIDGDGDLDVVVAGPDAASSALERRLESLEKRVKRLERMIQSSSTEKPLLGPSRIAR
jgi:RNA polymerase sigma factor (sigma-70 family)